MVIEGSGTPTPRGELHVGEVVHGAAINCTIVPYDAPEDGWFMKQFMTRQQLEDFAKLHRLIVRETEE